MASLRYRAMNGTVAPPSSRSTAAATWFGRAPSSSAMRCWIEWGRRVLVLVGSVLVVPLMVPPRRAAVRGGADPLTGGSWARANSHGRSGTSPPRLRTMSGNQL